MRKLHIFAIAALSVLVLGCGVGTGKDTTTKGPGVTDSNAGGATANTASAQGKDGSHAVVFEVTGQGRATSVTYGIGGNSSQAIGATLPWKKEATSTDSFLMLSLVAQSCGSGTISCRISVDGKVVVENSSEGQYAVVTCTKAA